MDTFIQELKGNLVELFFQLQFFAELELIEHSVKKIIIAKL